jgi:hypothetical protein
MILGNRIVKSFVHRIREKLCKIDFEGNLYVDQAAHALAFSNHIDLTGDEDTVVEGLQTNVDVHGSAVLYANDGVTEAFGHNDVERALAHLARPMQEIEDRDGVGGGGEV